MHDGQNVFDPATSSFGVDWQIDETADALINSLTMNFDYVKIVAGSKKRENVFFYIDNGGVGLESQLQPGIDEMISALKAKGYEEKKDFVYIVDSAAKHLEADWAKRFPNALTLALSN